MRRWTYLVVEIHDKYFGGPTENRLEELGDGGWELVSVVQLAEKTRLFLKQEITHTTSNPTEGT
jgi:hypothetical protein